MQLTMTEFFHRRWDEINLVIDYDDEWVGALSANELQYIDQEKEINYCFTGLANKSSIGGLRVGEVAKAMDDFGRKLIIVQTRVGLAVVYVCSRNATHGQIAFTLSKKINLVYPGLEVRDAKALGAIIGDPNGIGWRSDVYIHNIGEWFETVFQVMSDPTFQITSHLFFKPRNNQITNKGS